MSLAHILLWVFLSLSVRWLFPGKTRPWVILAISVVAVYWLQPNLPIRQLDFWLPTATIALVFLSWGLTTKPEAFKDKNNRLTAGLVIFLVLLISLTRFISLEGVLTASRPPQFHLVAVTLAIISGLMYVLVRYIKASKLVLILGVIVFLGILITLKTPALLIRVSMTLRSLAQQSTILARESDLEWLGFSYLAFRIIHVLLDRLNGRLPDLKLQDYFIYTIFYPTFLAGPIDRFQRFQTDLESFSPMKSEELIRYAKRFFSGLFKKFIIADTLAFFSLTPITANQANHSGWLWVMTFAFSLQIYFDFSGYTDIAIAAGGFLGFRLPENFNKPYLQPNITKFWNAWHITLTQWVRAYLFNPLARYFRRNSKLPTTVIIFIAQMSTMLAIGLWHGVTMNFLIWGAWHGLGLFIHNRWSNRFGRQIKSTLIDHPGLSTINNAFGVFSTFVFVSIGWLWFTIPDVEMAWTTLLQMFLIR